MMIKGAMNGEAFLAYIEQCLVPTLRRGDIVIADNVSFHKVAGVEEAIEARGAELRYLPQYSPDLNPIELVFHPLKALLRKAAERNRQRWANC
jgi:transposase